MSQTYKVLFNYIELKPFTVNKYPNKTSLKTYLITFDMKKSSPKIIINHRIYIYNVYS